MIKVALFFGLMLLPVLATGFSGEKNQKIDAYDLLIRMEVISQVISQVSDLRDAHLKSLPTIKQADFSTKFDKIYELYQLQSLGAYGMAMQESFNSQELKKLNHSNDLDMIKQAIENNAEYQKKLAKYLSNAQAEFERNLNSTKSVTP